jgi:hypothetical protein
MITLQRPDNRLYFGVGGSGKTTLALAHTWKFNRVIICDPNSEAAHTEGADVTQDRAELVELAREKTFRVCWRFELADPEPSYDWATRVALAAGNCVIVWDEAEFYVPTGTLPETARALWNAGRHRRCRAFACTRSPFAISRHLTRNLTRACVFAIQEESDQRWLKNFMGKEAAAAVPTLPLHHAVDWRQGGAWSVKKSVFD